MSLDRLPSAHARVSRLAGGLAVDVEDTNGGSNRLESLAILSPVTMPPPAHAEARTDHDPEWAGHDATPAVDTEELPLASVKTTLSGSLLWSPEHGHLVPVKIVLSAVAFRPTDDPMDDVSTQTLAGRQAATELCCALARLKSSCGRMRRAWQRRRRKQFAPTGACGDGLPRPR